MAVPLTGQITVSGTAQALTVAVNVTAWELKAPLTNTLPVYVGAAGVTSSTGHQLDPGDRIVYERASQNSAPRYELNPSDVYVVGTAPDKVTWFASPPSQ